MSNPMTTPEMAELSAASLRDAIAYARANDGVFPDGRGVRFVREVHINELEAVLNQLETLRTDSAQLREKNEELLADKARIDTLQELIYESDGGTLSMGGVCYYGIELKVPRHKVQRLGSGDDLREAIDVIVEARTPATPEPL